MLDATGSVLRRVRGDGVGRFGAAGVILVLVIGYPLVRGDAYHLSVGVNIAFLAMAAIGLTLAVGGAGQMALGQGGFMAIGAYSVGYLTTRHHTAYVLALLIGVVLAALAGVLVGYIALRLAGNYLAMATLAAGSIVYSLLVYSTDLGGSEGLYGIPSPGAAGVTLDQPLQQYWLMWAGVGLCFVGGSLLKRSYIGRELRAIRDDEVAARCVGINLTGRKVQIFAVSAVIGGLAGGLDAGIQSAIDPTLFSPNVSFQLFVIVVLGGSGSLAGAVAAAAVVQYSTQVISGSGNYALVLLGVIAIVVMAVLPAGFGGLDKVPAVRRLRARMPGRSSPPAPPSGDAEPTGGSEPVTAGARSDAGVP